MASRFSIASRKFSVFLGWFAIVQFSDDYSRFSGFMSAEVDYFWGVGVCRPCEIVIRQLSDYSLFLCII